jgi:hypothetical protein
LCETRTIARTRYLDWDDFEKILLSVSIPIVPIIAKGNWDTIIKLDPQFESIVYRIHDLSKIPSNYAEGYVIKPVKEIRYGEDQERLIWKSKNPSFS